MGDTKGSTKGVSLGAYHVMTMRRMFAPWWVLSIGWLASAVLFMLDRRSVSAVVLVVAVVAAVMVIVGVRRSTTTTTTTTRQSTVRRGAYSRWASRRRRV